MSKNILDLEIEFRDLGGEIVTLKDVFKMIIEDVWFSKDKIQDSDVFVQDWEHDIMVALYKAGYIDGDWDDEEGGDYDYPTGNELIHQAINKFFDEKESQ